MSSSPRYLMVLDHEISGENVTFKVKVERDGKLFAEWMTAADLVDHRHLLESYRSWFVEESLRYIRFIHGLPQPADDEEDSDYE